MPFFYVAAAAAVIGAGISSYRAVASGKAQAANARYQAQVAENNATIQQQNAKTAAEEGQQQVTQEQTKTAAFIGSQLAGQAANGLDVNDGTNVKLRASSAVLGEEDALTIQNDSARNVLAFENAGRNDQSQAQLDEFNASNDALAGYIQGAGSIVGGAGQVGSMGVQAHMAGII